MVMAKKSTKAEKVLPTADIVHYAMEKGILECCECKAKVRMTFRGRCYTCKQRAEAVKK